MSLLDAAGVVTGDIWCSGAFSFESPLKDLLDSGEYTLDQLLGEDELLQELRGIHPQLIDFFSSEEAVAGLVQYVILPQHAPRPKPFIVNEPTTTTTTSPQDPDKSSHHPQEESSSSTPVAAAAAAAAEGNNGQDKQDENEEENPNTDEDDQDTEQEQHDAVHVRYPYMACEVICCEVKGIIDLIVDGYVPTPTAAADGLQSVVSSSDDDDDDDDDNDGNDTNTEVTLKQNDPRPRTILDLLFSMLYDAKPGEIDDHRAGYFDKILSILFRKRPQAMSDYINEGGGRGTQALMNVMFHHLYSHSIMQIVQRLLLPQPPLPPKDDSDEDNAAIGDVELYNDPMDAADMDGLGSFRCKWSESRVALELLLDCLIGTGLPEIEQVEERKLSLYQNASEVLITIIQNSPLTSPTLHILTTDPVLEKLIMAASCFEEGTSFSPHDSRLTCTMNVLESLILQLGGYGSVGTVMYSDDEEDEEGEQDEDDEEENPEGVEVKDGEPTATRPNSMRQELATSDTLINHLPMMLSNLCKLLLYPEAENWVSPMQFSRTDPQKLLGSSRLRIVRLLESLVLLGDPNVDALLCESNCLEICLDLFWKFQWCSMLHQSVANLLVHVFEGANARSELQSYFLVKCNLLGRLMDSFWDPEDRLSEAVMAMKNVNDVRTSSVVSERGSDNSKDDVLPVSDDDVDAALERKGSEQVSQDVDEGVVDPSPAQSFRLGYMGHVIIICQALVHACTNECGEEGQSVEETDAGESRPSMNGELGQYVGSHSNDQQESSPEAGSLPEAGRTAESVVTEETPSNPLILAQLVETHPLSNRWHDFVTTTLASETAIQSTPLGGFAGSPGMDPLHSHRPGLAEDDDYDQDDGAAPQLPPRGLLVGGDVIDMDDNDLDVAASMMAGLSLGRPADGSDNRNDSDLLASIPQQPGGIPQHGGGYMFDDPLGDGRFGKFDDDSDSSSDDESEVSGNSGGALLEGVPGQEQEHVEAPVMDLFAGNIDGFGSNERAAGWSDFANFDDAFAGADSGASDEADKNDPTIPPNGDNIDDVFGDVKDHAILLEDLDEEKGHQEDIKVNSSEEDSSSDEEDPVAELESDTPEA